MIALLCILYQIVITCRPIQWLTACVACQLLPPPGDDVLAGGVTSQDHTVLYRRAVENAGFVRARGQR
jgi:hypothetical protein